MAVDGQVQFPVAAVMQHAGMVDRVAEAMGLARSAVHEVTMDGGAYGQLCQFLPALLSPVFGLAVDALQETVDSLGETAINLRTATTSTENTDAASARRVSTAGGGATGGGATVPLELPL